MTKVASSYASIVRGVSEQVPQDRLPGQHWEQVNMISDPRRGISRRHGSVTMDEQVLGLDPLTTDQHAYLRNYREYSFFVEGTEYSLVYQGAERPTSDTLPFCHCLNKDTGKFLNVVYSESSTGAMDPWRFGGLSAVTTVGKFVVMASNSLGPGYSVDDKYAASSNKAVAWVRGGAYSRTFTVTAKHTNGTTYTGTYTTLTSSYPNLLDTSDIVFADNPNYQKQVNDRVNAYNSAVNKWVGDASTSVQPQTIAANLRSSLVANGFPAGDVGYTGGTINFASVTELSCSDSGDGTLFRDVFNEIDDPAKLSTNHYNGKVVRVKPKGTDESYYMVAKTDAGSAYGTVTWVEGPSHVVTPGQVFALAAISDDGQTLTLSDSPSQLATATGQTVPGYSQSEVGDLEARGNLPYFFGRRITLLTVFMDRLVIVSNGVVFMSRVGDYFHWFRKSMLRVDADDPIEAYALGADDDIISRSVTYAKDLFMFGERNQYTISGRSALTPQTVSIAATASEKDAVSAQPIVVGNLLFYGKYGSTPGYDSGTRHSASVSQFQLGLFEGSPESFLVSQQLDKYLRGKVSQFAALPSPHTVFVRTEGNDFGLYVYRFIDQPGSQSRAFDSWTRWEWNPAVGRIIGFTSYRSTLLVYTIRENAQGPWVACEQFTMDSDLSTTSYLDAQRSPAMWQAGTGFFRADDATVLSDVYVAASQGSDVAFLGEHVDNFATFYTAVLDSGAKPAVVGVEYEADTQLTSPFVRDRNDKALVNGRLVVNRYTVSITDTAGLDAYRLDTDGETRVFGFNGRRVGLSNNQVGRQPVTTATVDISCGRANTEHRMSLRSRKWLPLTISAIEWVGQLFINAKRV